MQQKSTHISPHTVAAGMENLNTMLYQHDLPIPLHEFHDGSHLSCAYGRQHAVRSPEMTLASPLNVTAETGGWPELELELYCLPSPIINDFVPWPDLLDYTCGHHTASVLSPVKSNSSQASSVFEGVGIPRPHTGTSIPDTRKEHRKERRRAQNRAAQRRHRERRQLTHGLTRMKVIELECALATALEQEKIAREENDTLRRRLAVLEEAQTGVGETRATTPSEGEAAYIFDPDEGPSRL
ncbi:hypothetical protein PV04_06600 [Phialophora macrospora]|uniref:BZIP domain-containing protein n=1 Tax=Phialophora macrospora TaxID=1851006 RepID=A0A0D2DYY5_9EURO|nr:hypothetical protein PV04_06600 [Phialophora macrospora]